MPEPRLISGLAATARDLSENAETSRAVATSDHSPARKLPPMTDCGAKPIECTTPSSASTCSRTRSASAARSSASVTSSRSEEHTSELQSRPHLVCRLLLEKKKKNNRRNSQQPHNNKQTR